MSKHQISILGVNNKQYSVAEFQSQNKDYTSALGIILETPVISIVLALECWNEQWGNTDAVLTEAQDEASALQTLSGLELTKRIVEAQANMEEMTAAKRCWNYGAGGLQWYLPCLMELGAICAYKDEINEVMEAIGCPSENLLPDDEWVWSSSEHSQNGSWYVNFGSGYFYSAYKYISLVVRAVAAFSASPSLLTGEAKSNDCLHSDEALINMLRERGYKGELTKTLTI